tara:strand:+ start:102 stop:749 length:648 start_codon:yes stop_codon:yes gene_type:complete
MTSCDLTRKKDYLGKMPVIVFLSLFFLMVSILQSFADEGYYYGHEIKVEEPKLSYDQEGNLRLANNGDGTVTDFREKLMWKKKDSYQELKQWLNWHDANVFVKKLNDNQFAGKSDWRLPTRKELATLYDETKEVPWKYYWTENMVHIDPIFGNTGCCFWTSEEKKDFAYGYNFIRGQSYMSMKGGIQKSLTVIRPVRTITESLPDPEKLKTRTME